MTKQELVSEIAAKVDGCTVTMAAAVLAAVTDTIKEAVAGDVDVTLRGFGTFKRTYKAAKQARNLVTGETMIIQAHYVPTFKACNEFKDSVK